jgi:hypothetical protein
MHGAVGSKNEIAAKLAYYAKQPVGMQALRNLLILGEVLGSLDPMILAHTKKEIFDRREDSPPSLWQLFRKAMSRDGRRGIAIILGFVSGIGRSAWTPES